MMRLRNNPTPSRETTRRRNDINISSRVNIPREIKIKPNSDDISEVSIDHLEVSHINRTTKLVHFADEITHMLRSPLFDGTHEAFNINSTIELVPKRPSTSVVNTGQLPSKEHNKCLPKCSIL
jgi:hypothetical protein